MAHKIGSSGSLIWWKKPMEERDQGAVLIIVLLLHNINHCVSISINPNAPMFFRWLGWFLPPRPRWLSTPTRLPDSMVVACSALINDFPLGKPLRMA